MPEASTEFGKIEKSVHNMAHSMESASSSSKQTSDALGSLLKTLLIVDVTLKGLEKMSAFSPMARNLKEAFTTLGKTRDQLISIHDAELDAAQERYRQGQITEEQLKIIEEKTYARLPLLNAQLALEREINKVGTLRLALLTATVTAMGRLFYISQDFNETNIKANAEWNRRRDLFYTNLQIQRETGIAFRSVAEAQRDLINYGFQTRRDYADVLKTVVLLHEGVGMSVRAATDLAVVAERQVKTSFKATADVVAELVNETSLAADEVERMAKTLGPLILAIQPRGAPAFPQIMQALGQYEDAIKRLGGMGDEFTQMIAKMLKPEGLLQAGVLGIRDPQMLLKASGVKQAMEAFRRYTDQMLGNATGVDRIFRMQMLADTFGTSYEQMSLMVEAAKNANTAMNERVTLEERFHRQMQAAGEGFKRIYNSLTALLERALYPAIIAINWMTNFIANLLQTILKYKPLVFIAIAAIDIAIVMTVIKLRNAAKAFWEVVVAAQVAAESLKKYAREQLAQSAMNVVGGRAGGLAQQGEFIFVNQLEKKLAPTLGQQFGNAIKSFGAALSTRWKPSFDWKSMLFGSKQLELDLGERTLAGMARKIGTEVATETRPILNVLRTFNASVLRMLAQLGLELKGLVGVFRTGLVGIVGTLGRILLTGFTWLLRGISMVFTPLGLIVAALGALTFVLVKTWQTQTKMLENQMQTHARLADMRQRFIDTARMQIYMASRAGDKAEAQRVMASVDRYINSQVRQGTLTAQEGALEKAKFSKQLETLVPLAQYTATQFGKLRLTPTEREEQSKDNLEFQKNIADNTKKSLEEARRALNEEKSRDETDRQARELRYLRNGGVTGRYIGMSVWS